MILNKQLNLENYHVVGPLVYVKNQKKTKGEWLLGVCACVFYQQYLDDKLMCGSKIRGLWVEIAFQTRGDNMPRGS